MLLDINWVFKNDDLQAYLFQYQNYIKIVWWLGSWKMDPHKMTLQELGKHFYGRIVQFNLKNGKKKTIFVQDIMNEEDDEPELTFIGGSEENEVRISEIVSACEIKK